MRTIAMMLEMVPDLHYALPSVKGNNYFDPFVVQLGQAYCQRALQGHMVTFRWDSHDPAERLPRSGHQLGFYVILAGPMTSEQVVMAKKPWFVRRQKVKYTPLSFMFLPF
jgi:hypothetical protein